MNVRKRGLALLLCVCMIFTLLPFSALAADSDVVYGQYVNGEWKQDASATASKTYTDDTGANIVYSKEAKATGTPNVYDVTLTIETTTTKTAPGASAVVLVIDTSKSMENARIRNAKLAAKSFAENYGKTGGERYLAVVSFNNSASAQNFGTNQNPVYWLNVSDPANLSKVQTAIEGMQLSKDTNLSGGLHRANDLFNDSTVSSIIDFKYAVVLTDGEPNKSDVSGEGNAYNAAAQRATELKSTGCEVYTIGVSLGNDAKTFLQTKVASSTDKAYTTDNADELNNIFSDIFKEIEKGITSGFTVSDPMGDYAVLQNTELTDCVIADNGLTWTPKTGESVTNADDSTTTTYTLTYQVKLDVDSIPDDGTYPLNDVTTLTFGGETLNFNVPGVKGEVPRYTVTYNKGANGSLAGQDDDGNVVTSNLKKGTATPTAPAVTPDNGYYFTGWSPEVADKVTANVTYTAQYAEKTVLTVTANSAAVTYNGETRSVNGFKQLEFNGNTVSGLSASASGKDVGNYTTIITGTAKVTDAQGNDVTEQFTVNTVEGTLTIDPASVTVKADDQSKVYGAADPALTASVTGLIGDDTVKYTVSREVGENVGTYTITPTGAETQGNYVVTYETGTLTIAKAETALVVTANSAEKTYDGKALTDNGYELTSGALAEGDKLVVVVEGSQTDAGSSANVVKSVKVMRGDVDVTANYNIGDSVNGTLTVTTKAVTFTGESASKVYNGEEQEITDITVEGLLDGHTYSSLSYSAKGTDAGEYNGVFSGEVVIKDAEDNDVTANYAVTKTVGKLTITPITDKVTVTITGKTDSEKYDGEEHSVNGYDVEISNPLYTEADFTFNGTATASGTNAGTYAMGLKAADFENTNTNFTTVEFVVIDGSLTINPASVTVTADDQSKVYGAADPALTASVTGLIGEDTVAYTVSRAEGEDVGTYTITPSGDAEQGNYVVEYKTGTLTITKAGTLTVAGTDYNGVYDGKAHGDSATANVTEGTTISYKVGEGDWTNEVPTITNVGSMTVNVKAENSNYKTATATYTLTVTPASVTVTADDQSKVYGEADPALTASVTGLIGEDTVTYTVSRAEGEDVGTYTITPSGDAEQGNYVVEYKTGTLTITKAGTLTVAGTDYNGVYDGKAHGDSATANVTEGTTISYKVGEGDWTNEVPTITNVGSMTVSVKAENSNYETATATYTLTVTPKAVTFTGESASKVYNGEEQEITGITVEGLLDGHTYSSLSYSAKGTDAGEYNGVFSGDVVIEDAEGNNVTANYAVTKTVGTLTITAVADKVTVTITGNTDSKKYNGEEHSVNGYEVSIDNELYTEADFKFNGTATASGKDAGTYAMGLKASDFENISKNFSNVVFVVTDGSLTITPRNITLTSGSAEKEYDGTPLTNSEVTVGGDGFADGEGATYNVTGTITNVGSVDNEFTYALNEGTNAGNYTIETETGTLTITAVADKVTVTITGKTDSQKYDGADHSVNGYDVEISNPLYTEADFTFNGTATASGKDAGTYAMGLEASDFENISKNFSNVEFVIEQDGVLTITPRSITLTSGSAEKEYDGTPLTNSDVTVTGDGFVDGEGATYTVTGSQTEVGKSDNTFTYTLNEGTLAQNYTIETIEGILEVTKIQAEVIVTIDGATDTVYYNGKEQSVTGHEWSSDAKFADKISVTLKEEGKDTASGIKPDTYYMGLTEADFNVTSDVYANITVVVNDGWLKIKRRPVAPTPDKITVTITGNTDSKVYDGTEQNVNGYTWVSSDPSYTENDFEFTGKADANGTYVGSYDMGITADQFKNINSRYTVEFIVETDGELKITPKPLTITAGSKEGVAPVTCDEWTATETAKGDTIVDVTITGIQPVPGESPNKASNAVIKNEAGTDVTSNYDITYVDGVLRAIEVLNKEEHFNYVIGYTDGTIRPGNNISRAEIATIFFRLLKDDVREKYMTTDCDFSDVASGAWCRRAIATLTNIGIIHGYTDGTFRPNAQITRAELATIIARFANLDVNTKTFNDITGHWAQKSIELAAGNGWINGYTDGTFRPNNKITRAETFAMINRVLDRQTKSADDLLPQSEMNMWSDNMDESAWYYRDVQEATNYHKCDRVGDSIYEKWTAKITDIDWAVYQI